MKRQKTNILLIGPLPILSGGASVLFKQLIDELSVKPEFHIDVINTGRESKDSIVGNILKMLEVLFSLINKIASADVVSFHSSPRGTVYFGSIVYMLTRFFNKPLIIREFGGVLDQKYLEMPGFKKKLLAMIFNSERVLLETKKMVNFFRKEFPKANLVWYANSRPFPENGSKIKENKSGTVKFIYVGHVKPTKGVLVIAEAVKLMQSLSFAVDIYGPMLEGVTESDFAGIRNLKYCGALKPGDVVSTIEKYDAFLFPSFYEGEGYPGVILEAYMAGIPVITTDWISIPEIVEDGKSGIIIEPKNPQQLAEAMTELINDKEKLTAIKKGVIEYRKEFSSVIWTEKFIRLVNELSSVE